MNLPVYEPYRHFDYNLEGAILGACLLEKFAISRILSVIEDESIFYNEANRIVFKAMLAMLDESMPIDIFTVSQFIVNRMKIRELGEGNVAYYLVKLTNAVVSTANLEVHAFLLLECWKQRKLVEIKYGAIDSDLSAGENIDSITESLNKVMRSKMSADWLPMDELLIQLYQHQAEMEKAKGIGLLTGFNTIDRNGGFFAPNFVLLGARPGVGKSAFANSIAINVAKQNKTVGIISLEMGNVEIASRLAAIDTKTDFSLVFRGLINDERESRNFHETLNNQTAGLPIYVSDKTGVTMPEIRRRAEVLKHRKGVDLLIIDYLQLIDTHNSNNRSRENEIAVISRGLKILAKDLDIPILVLAQLNRESTKRTGEQRYPVLGDIRESGSLEQDTDIVFFLHSDYLSGVTEDREGRSTEGYVELINRKWRNFKLGETKKLRFNGKLMQFTDMDESEQFIAPKGFVKVEDKVRQFDDDF